MGELKIQPLTVTSRFNGNNTTTLLRLFVKPKQFAYAERFYNSGWGGITSLGIR